MRASYNMNTTMINAAGQAAHLEIAVGTYGVVAVCPAFSSCVISAALFLWCAVY